MGDAHEPQGRAVQGNYPRPKEQIVIDLMWERKHGRELYLSAKEAVLVLKVCVTSSQEPYLVGVVSQEVTKLLKVVSVPRGVLLIYPAVIARVAVRC